MSLITFLATEIRQCENVFIVFLWFGVCTTGFVQVLSATQANKAKPWRWQS